MELSSEVREVLSHLPPLDLLWLKEAGIPVCLIKVPASVSFATLTLRLGKPSLQQAPSNEGYVVAIPLEVRLTPESPPLHSWSFFNPTGQRDQLLLTALSQAHPLDLLVYTDGELSYQGRKHLAWAESHRQKARQMVTRPFALETQWPQAREHVRQRLEALQRRQLPLALVEKLRSPLTRSIVVLPDEPNPPVRFLVKVPRGTRFADIAVAFDPFHLYAYVEGNLLCIPIRLQDPLQRTLVADCLLNLDDLKDLSLLEKLATLYNVEVFAVADETPYLILGAKQLHWPEQRRESTQQVLRWVLRKKQPPKKHQAKTHRLSAAARYQRSHPCDITFRRREISDTAFSHEGLSATFPRSLSGEASYTYDAVLGEGQSLIENSVSNHQSLLGAVIEQFRHHQWVLVEAAKSQPNTTMFRQGWHLLLAGGAEKARKLLWTPEALEVVAQQRLHLPSLHEALLRLPQTHRWFEFQEPVETSICPRTAALFLLDMQDRQLLQHLVQQVPSSAQILNQLAREVFRPERQIFSINVISSEGELMWTCGFGIRGTQGQRNMQPYWFPPPWYHCLSGHCQGLLPRLTRDEASPSFAFCAECQEAQHFFSSWVATAWYLLMGFHRPQRETYVPDADDQEYLDQARKIGLLDNRPYKQIPDNDTHYRIARQIDLSSGSPHRYDEPLDSRGSWVEALLAQDPAALLYEQRDVPGRTRTLRHPRYAAYIQRTGSNQVEVQPHKKRVPMRANPKAYTKVRAKDHEQE
jgi:hypothetical protein